MSARSAARSSFAIALALGAGAGPLASAAVGQSRKLPRPQLVAVTNTTTIDPCAIVSPDETRRLLEAWLRDAFPIKRSFDGQHVTFSRPDLRGFSCPDLRFELRVRVRYQKTRGFPQYSSTGQARLSSHAGFLVRHRPVEVDRNVEASRIERAFVYLGHMNVIAVNLRRVPNWLESEQFIRDMLLPALSSYNDRPCRDVTNWMEQQVANGRDLPANGGGARLCR